MKIKAYQNRYNMELGESPNIVIAPEFAEAWYGRDPFEDTNVAGVSGSLQMENTGTTDGHNLVFDKTFSSSLRVGKWVPVSPLFVKDLCGRVVYIGYGPERKGNSEWAAYQVDVKTAKDGEINPFVPLCAFPRFCRDVSGMEGAKLLEQVFLTKFRCLEMSMDFNGMLSGADPEADLVNATYNGANLYPYKLRLDTYYIDGWKLPQTQMVYARGENLGVNPVAARKLGEKMLEGWEKRGSGVGYAEWYDGVGEAEFEKMYQGGCTLIPTFEACNGFHVVSKDFELEDYWPGRVAAGLHEVVGRKADKAPRGTILEVVEPGFVTAAHVHPARVIMSDGSGYVSPNNENPPPLMPNLHLPHTRVVDNWESTWIPTHPEHFEAPALWGWDLNTGRFMQLHGPLWDPLHYYYESVDKVLAAFDASPVSDKRPLVPVPEEMEHRFYPVAPMKGYDTFSEKEYASRRERGVKPRSCLKRMATEDYTAGIGYHPMPAEFEFELDTFWFPELHPANRGQGIMPDSLLGRICPVITPRVAPEVFTASVDAPEAAVWLKDERRMAAPQQEPEQNYPELARYLVPEMEIEDVVKVCPVPFLSDPGDRLGLTPEEWWKTEDGEQLDSEMVLQELIPDVHAALWEMRREGIQMVRLRHMVYRTQLPLYMLAWWQGWSVPQLAEAMQEWIRTEEAAEVAALTEAVA